MTKPTLLLHTCCAPCLAYVYQLLDEAYSITIYFYNPNIAPLTEYNKRLEELQQFTLLKKIDLIVGDHDIHEWTGEVKKYRSLGEKSKRCYACYAFRLNNTFIKAQSLQYDMVATVLSISPHKNASELNDIGSQLEKKYDIKYLEADFKKKDGFKNSVMLSKKYKFYRQDYCGCAYSRVERNKNSLWLQNRLNKELQLTHHI